MKIHIDPRTGRIVRLENKIDHVRGDVQDAVTVDLYELATLIGKTIAAELKDVLIQQGVAVSTLSVAKQIPPVVVIDETIIDVQQSTDSLHRGNDTSRLAKETAQVDETLNASRSKLRSLKKSI